MAFKWADYQKMSDDEIVALYDRNVEYDPQQGYSNAGLRAEIAFRSQDKINKTMLGYAKVTLNYTKQVTLLTWATTVISIVALATSLIALLHGQH